MKLAATIGFCLLLWTSPGKAQSCHTSAQPRNPAPTGDSSRARIAGDFNRGEERTEVIDAQSGKSYWFSASGCPRMGTIRIDVLNAAGKVLKSEESYGPSFCISAPDNGKLTLRVTAVSLSGSNSWGSIESYFADSNCKTPAKAKK